MSEWKEEYVDKSGLISLLNGTLDSTRGLTCISRPRRFGKSYVTQMLGAYYDRSCDAEELFKDLVISKDPSFQEHLNRYIVISLDITNFVSQAKRETSGAGFPCFTIWALTILSSEDRSPARVR